MAGIFEQTGYDAMASISRITPPEKPAARHEREHNRYDPQDAYKVDLGITDVVKDAVGEKEPSDLYLNPVRAMEKDPKRSIYASLLNYEFLS